MRVRRRLELGISLIALLAASGCDGHSAISEATKRNYYGDAFIYPGAPFYCLYIGLETNETGAFATHFWRFADRHGIRKPARQYLAYSGPPMATCKNEHVSVFVSSTATTNIVWRHDRSSKAQLGELVAWQEGIWFDAYWPTNASRISKNGQEVLAPFTGRVGIAPNDTNYPLRDFRQLCDRLASDLQSAFPDRPVRAFFYDGQAQRSRAVKDRERIRMNL